MLRLQRAGQVNSQCELAHKCCEPLKELFDDGVRQAQLSTGLVTFRGGGGAQLTPSLLALVK
jgi:hypothetical protein